MGAMAMTVGAGSGPSRLAGVEGSQGCVSRPVPGVGGPGREAGVPTGPVLPKQRKRLALLEVACSAIPPDNPATGPWPAPHPPAHAGGDIASARTGFTSRPACACVCGRPRGRGAARGLGVGVIGIFSLDCGEGADPSARAMPPQRAQAVFDCPGGAPGASSPPLAASWVRVMAEAGSGSLSPPCSLKPVGLEGAWHRRVMPHVLPSQVCGYVDGWMCFHRGCVHVCVCMRDGQVCSCRRCVCDGPMYFYPRCVCARVHMHVLPPHMLRLYACHGLACSCPRECVRVCV